MNVLGVDGSLVPTDGASRDGGQGLLDATVAERVAAVDRHRVLHEQKADGAIEEHVNIIYRLIFIAFCF